MAFLEENRIADNEETLLLAGSLLIIKNYWAALRPAYWPLLRVLTSDSPLFSSELYSFWPVYRSWKTLPSTAPLLRSWLLLSVASWWRYVLSCADNGFLPVLPRLRVFFFPLTYGLPYACSKIRSAKVKGFAGIAKATPKELPVRYQKNALFHRKRQIEIDFYPEWGRPGIDRLTIKADHRVDWGHQIW